MKWKIKSGKWRHWFLDPVLQHDVFSRKPFHSESSASVLKSWTELDLHHCITLTHYQVLLLSPGSGHLDWTCCRRRARAVCASWSLGVHCVLVSGGPQTKSISSVLWLLFSTEDVLNTGFDLWFHFIILDSEGLRVFKEERRCIKWVVRGFKTSIIIVKRNYSCYFTDLSCSKSLTGGRRLNSHLQPSFSHWHLAF